MLCYSGFHAQGYALRRKGQPRLFENLISKSEFLSSLTGTTCHMTSMHQSLLCNLVNESSMAEGCPEQVRNSSFHSPSPYNIDFYFHSKSSKSAVIQAKKSSSHWLGRQ